MRPTTARLLLPLHLSLLALAGCDGHPPRQEIGTEPQASTDARPNQLLSTALDDGAGQVPVDEPDPVAEPEAPAANGCDSNYDPCVPIDSDVDCAGGKGNGPSYAAGPVRVVGSDVYGLDRDGDGVGCDR